MPSPKATQELIERSNIQDYISNFRQRWEFHDIMDGRPLIQSDLEPAAFSQASQRLLDSASFNWMSAGTNMVSANTSFSSPGIQLSTAGANNDQAMVVPATVTGVNSISAIGGSTGAAGTAPWDSLKQLRFQALINLGQIANTRFFCGWKLAANMNIATDTDEALFSYDTGVANVWQCVSRVGGVSTTQNVPATDSQALAFKTPVANTNILLEIKMDYNNPVPGGASSNVVNRQCTFMINRQIAAVGPALTTPMRFIPFFGIQALTGAAQTFIIRNVRLSRTY